MCPAVVIVQVSRQEMTVDRLFLYFSLCSFTVYTTLHMCGFTACTLQIWLHCLYIADLASLPVPCRCAASQPVPCRCAASQPVPRKYVASWPVLAGVWLLCLQRADVHLHYLFCGDVYLHYLYLADVYLHYMCLADVWLHYLYLADVWLHFLHLTVVRLHWLYLADVWLHCLYTLQSCGFSGCTLQICGFSPVWTRMWVTSLYLALNGFVFLGQPQARSTTLKGTVQSCRFSSNLSVIQQRSALRWCTLSSIGFGTRSRIISEELFNFQPDFYIRGCTLYKYACHTLGRNMRSYLRYQWPLVRLKYMNICKNKLTISRRLLDSCTQERPTACFYKKELFTAQSLHGTTLYIWINRYM